MELKRLLKINWIKSVYFNFHYLPIKQAVKLPIILFSSKLLKCHGQVVIESDTIRTGMIQFGEHLVSLYPNKGMIWENKGGKIIFNGNCIVGNSSAISIGEKGFGSFGNNFRATAGLKLTIHHSVQFGENVLIAWDVLIMDTSFHRLKDSHGTFKNKGYGSISIGKNNWITAKCMILNGTKTPDYCILGAGSVLNKDYSNLKTHILLAGNPLEVKAEDVWIDLKDHDISEYS